MTTISAPRSIPGTPHQAQRRRSSDSDTTTLSSATTLRGSRTTGTFTTRRKMSSPQDAAPVLAREYKTSYGIGGAGNMSMWPSPALPCPHTLLFISRRVFPFPSLPHPHAITHKHSHSCQNTNTPPPPHRTQIRSRLSAPPDRRDARSSPCRLGYLAVFAVDELAVG